jgi:hypothetical protein
MSEEYHVLHHLHLPTVSGKDPYDNLIFDGGTTPKEPGDTVSASELEDHGQNQEDIDKLVADGAIIATDDPGADDAVEASQKVYSGQQAREAAEATASADADEHVIAADSGGAKDAAV